MMEWIKCSERLPTCDGEYLVTLKGGHVCKLNFVIYFKQYDKIGLKFYGPAWPDDDLGGIHNNITYWMPLPEGPKE